MSVNLKKVSINLAARHRPAIFLDDRPADKSSAILRKGIFVNKVT